MRRDEPAGFDRYRGTFRVLPPYKTWARIEPLLGMTGVTRVANHTGMDDLGIPVYGAVRPDARCSHYALGKGVTELLSKISACMEAIEVWHAEHCAAELLAVSTRELERDGLDVLSPSALAPGSTAVQGDGVRMDWIRGATLAGEPIWVPVDAVRLDSVTLRLLNATTNGLASGNTSDEAILHGILELCERDAVAEFVRTGRATRIDPSDVDDLECAGLLHKYDAAGFDMCLLDITNELGVPTVVVYVRGQDTTWTFCGAGAHLIPAVALSRALTEAAQLRLLVKLAIRDDVDDRYARSKPARSAWPATSHLEPSALTIEPPGGSRSLKADIRSLGELLWSLRKVDPIVIDLTRPELALPVVKVLAANVAENLSFFAPTARPMIMEPRC